MPIKVWDRLNLLTGYAVVLALFVAVFLTGGKEIGDGDTVFHIKAGEYILQHGIPTKDIFTCSLEGKPWIDHEWLFQILLQNGFRINGFNGVVAIQRFLLFSIFTLLLFFSYRKDRQMAVLAMLFFILLVFRSRSLIRADNISIFFLLIDLGILLFHLKKKWAIWTLGAFQVLWVNMHGFFIFGPILIGIFIGAEWIKRHWPLPYDWGSVGTLSDDEYRALKWSGLVTVAVCFLNPQWANGVLYPLWVIKESAGELKFFFHYIKELNQPFTWANVMEQAGYPQYKVLFILSAASFLFNWKKVDIRLVVLWAIFAWFSLVAVRNLVFFAVIAGIVFMTNIKEIKFTDVVPVQFTDQKFKFLAAIVLKLFLLMWIINYGKEITGKQYYDLINSRTKKLYAGGITSNNFPHKAADFLIQNNIRGNFFNNLGSGAYLISRVHPHIKVFIDGRTEVFGARFFHDYRKIYEKENQELLEEVVKKFNIIGVFLTSVKKELPPRFLQYLYSHPDWKLVYLDHDAVIFLKNTEENRDNIQRYGLDLRVWKPSEDNIARLQRNRLEVRPFYQRALNLERLGFYDQALAEMDAALKVYPLYSQGYELMGNIHFKKGNDAEALYYYRVRALNQPGQVKKQMDVAELYQRLGQKDRAFAWTQKIIENFPKHSSGYFLLSRLLAEERKYDEAYSVLLKALQLYPKYMTEILETGDAAYENKDYAQAQRFYRLALKNEPNLVGAYYKVGLTYLKQNDSSMARNFFREGLKISPQNEELLEVLRQLPAPGF